VATYDVPLADADADALCQVTLDIFCVPSVGLTGAVAEKRHGYATWSFFPPQSEALVADHMRPLMEGRLGVRDERRAGLAPRLD
jgi:raffinose/stachyose/melibiose transport system substrate-binding protein